MKNKYEIRGDVTAIFVNYKGKVIETIIDTDDLEHVESFPNSWFGAKTGENVYVLGTVKKKMISLHRWIMGKPVGKVVDHINHDTLNNRKSNLRIVSRRDNSCNLKEKTRKNNTSGYRGITWSKNEKRWLANVQVGGKKVLFRLFDNLEDARKAVSEVRAYYMPASHDAQKNLNPDIGRYIRKPDEPQSNNRTSGVRNVCWIKEKKMWQVQFRKDKKTVFQERFNNLEDAIKKANEIRDSLK